jgi:SAM-dependent methyltransferase
MRRTLLTELMAQAPYQPATNYWRAVEIEEVVHHGLPHGLGLDLGCGDGHLMSIILHHLGSRQLIGVDIDQQETAIAAKRNIYQEVITTAGDRLPFPEDHFDFAFSNSVLEHIGPIDDTLKDVARVLKPGARFMFTVPGPDFHACLREPRGRNRHEFLREVDARCAHLRYWNAEEWTSHLYQAGMKLTHRHGYLVESDVQRWEKIARNTSGLLYRLVKQKKQPIELQRQMGIRSKHIRLPGFLARMAAGVIDKSTRIGEQFGCLLIEAQKN